MAMIDVVPSLEELSLVDVCGQQCMPGVETNLAELLLTAAEATPDRVCLEVEGESYTFAQVARMANSIRKVLRKALTSLDIPSASGEALAPEAHQRRSDEHVVTIVLDRGVRSIAAVHAVMLERCAYNAFDVGEPVEKLRSWVEVSRPPVMISNAAVLKRLGLADIAATLGDFPRVVIDADLALKKADSRGSGWLPAKHDPEDLDRLAYLIFTSGSTGKPKAVMIRHKSALNVVRIWGKYVGLGSHDRFAQVASMSWDVHIIEVYGTMSVGATSVTCPDMIKKSGPDMQVWLKDREITGMSVVPSHLRTMAGGGADVSRSSAGLPHLRILDVGGEALGADVVSTWAPGRRLFNSYGPSEISVVCTGAYVNPGDVITIGAELPTYTCYILDPETLERKADGERGVLFVGGIGLARGYLEEEEKTRAKFLDLPGLGRVYNTGDLALRDETGRIQYHGRVDWQVKVRGIRIELEALEQAIVELPAVKHCEARVLDDGQRLVLLASGQELSEAELKATAASLGRGYVLSQVKIVENDAWKFNPSGKLLRNVVPLEEEVNVEAKKDGWESFDKTGVSDLELEIAACLAPQLTVAEWNRDSHFMEDLGVDSGGFGRLISQMRSKPRLQRIDLQMLFERPTVRSLASALAEQSADSDSEDDVNLEPDLLDSFLEAVKEHPHAVCLEGSHESLSYLQLHRQMMAYQRLLHQAKPSRGSVVAICLESMDRLGAMLGVLREGCAFSFLGSDLSEQIKLLKPDFILASSDESSWDPLSELCDGSSAQTSSLLDVSTVSSLLSQPPKARKAMQGDDVCCVALEVHRGVQSAVPASHRTVLQALSAWCSLVEGQRISSLTQEGTAGDILSHWSILAQGATLVTHDAEQVQQARSELLICEHDKIPRRGAGQRKILHIAAEGGFTAVPSIPKFAPAGTAESLRSRALRSSSMLSLASSLAPYILGQSQKEGTESFGDQSRPVLCAAVQGLAILGQPIFVASRLLLAERVLLPLAFMLPLWQTFLLLVALLTLEQFVRVLILVVVKWSLIGRYKEGDHDIYSFFYLRHWLVEHMAKGTIVGQNAHQGSSIAFLFLRNLALRALGADVGLTSVVTARVVAYDLVSVGDLATVHGPRHLTAVNYGSRRMVLKPVKIGAGAYVGPNCTLEPGCEIAAAGYVEPLSAVPSGMVVDSRVCGVPAQVVGPKDLSRLPGSGEVRSFRRRGAFFATAYWMLLLPKALMPLLGVVAFQLLSVYPWDHQEVVREESMYPEHVDVLPTELMERMKWIPLIAFGASMLNTVLQLGGTAVLCRVLPKVKPPCTYSLLSIRAQIAALKMSMVLQASEMLADASIVPAFIRMCGATFGHGCAMGLQVTLPETLVVGKGCFFATGNILTSVDVDQGKFNVPCITYMSDHTFLGNHNHLPEGLPEGSFCGVGTWLPKRPTEPNMSYFGNPAMKFRRLSSQAAGKVNRGPEAASCLARFWHHFSTSILDVFLYRGVQGSVTALAMLTSRLLCPMITATWEVFALLLVYVAFALVSWYLFSVVLGNLLFNGSTPHSNAYYSTTVTRWFTALTAQQRVFKLPFQTAGTR